MQWQKTAKTSTTINNQKHKSFIICPIAIAYSIGQIMKSVCICQSVCPSASTLTVAFLDRFSLKLADVKTPKGRTSLLGVNIAPPLFQFCPLKPPF